jgi:MFS family permease
MIRPGLVRKNHCSLLAFSGTVTTYMGFAFASAQWHIWLFFSVYGLFSGLAEGAERALVIDLVPDEWRGRALGAYRAAVGIAMLSYGYAGAKPAFILGAVLALTTIPILPSQGADNGREQFCWETHGGCWIFARLKFIDVLVNQE